MFTGIVEETGRVESLKGGEAGAVLRVEGRVACQGSRLGESIAVNGVCLTITAMAGEMLDFGLAPETLRRTNLGGLKPGDGVNLERAVPAGGRMGGHFVQGHVDGTGTITAKHPDGDSLEITVAAPPEVMEYLVAKGFITVDGVSLTLMEVGGGTFSFMLVGYTQNHVILPRKPVGAPVNLEVDILAKYARKFMAPAV